MKPKIKKKDILNNSSIKIIASENVNKDMDNIKVIADIAPSYKKTITKLVFSLLLIGTGAFLVISAIVLCLNTDIVQGNIEGSIIEIGGFSIVDKDYDPAHYLTSGKTIYYDNDGDNIIDLSSAFKKAKVDRVVGNHVYIEGSVKETSININEVNYVLKEGQIV